MVQEGRVRSLPAHAVLLLAVAMAAGCSDASKTLGFDYNFAQGPAGWVAGFADYPAANEDIFMLEADYRPLREPLDTSTSALFITGMNRSDDLWMYYKAQAGLPADTSYRVTFDVEIATTAPSGCFGVGGAPGEGVSVKAGVSLVEPDAVLDPAGYWRMNVDKGQQTNGGEAAIVLGDLANSRSCEDGFVWEIKRLNSNGQSLQITTDGTGSVWLFVGTDSGFESISALYYTRFQVSFEPL